MGDDEASKDMNSKIDEEEAISSLAKEDDKWEEGGSVGVVKIDLETTSLGHNFRDPNGDRLPTIKDND